MTYNKHDFRCSSLQVYFIVATKLTEWERHRAQTDYDNSLNLKLWLLQFINYFSTLFYIAFFKGR